MAVPHLNLIIGEFGSGKSLRLLEIGLETCERYRKGLTTNFPINKQELKKYCYIKGYKWCLQLIKYEKIKFVSITNSSQLPKILERRNTVVLIDEAGIFLNSRSWLSVPKDFLAALVQIRHDGIFIFFAAHFIEQVDKQVRETCQRVIICKASTKYSKKLQNDRIIFRWWHEFKPASFYRWLENPQNQTNFLRTWFLASKNQFPLIVFPYRLTFFPARLSKNFSALQRLFYWLLHTEVEISKSAVIQLFSCFDSWGRLDKPDHGRRRHFLAHRKKSYEQWHSERSSRNGSVSSTLDRFF